MGGLYALLGAFQIAELGTMLLVPAANMFLPAMLS